ncbi:MAG: hypothetical protein II617_02085 [Firmicutes bacterium]|nr:hypothetical protein [Bacillota bacterium]
MNSILYYCFVILSVVSGFLAERGGRRRLVSLLTGFTAGSCMLIAGVNLYYHLWIPMVFVLVLFFWLPQVGSALSKLLDGRKSELTPASWLYLVFFICLAAYEIYTVILVGTR